MESNTKKKRVNKKVKEEEKMTNKTMVFALSASKGIAEEVCKQMGIEVSPAEVFHFADGEILIQLQESVRGKNVYIIQSTNTPVSDNLMEVLIAIDAAKRASAEHITVVIPYFGYARQDRKAKPRQPITSKLVSDLLETAGADRVMMMELHATQIQGFFDIPVDDISGICILGKHFNTEEFKSKNLVVVSPDHGGTTRARRLAEMLNCPIAIIDKRRTKPNVAEAMHLIGDVEGKTAIIIDDMVDTAGTLVAGIDMLFDKGAIEVHACAVHGVLSGPAIDRLKNSKLKSFVTTNTIDQSEKQKLYPEMVVLDIGEILGKVIMAIEEGLSISKVLKDYHNMELD